MRKGLLLCLLASLTGLLWGQSPEVVNGRFLKLTEVPTPPHADQGYGVWTVKGGRIPANWQLNPYLTGTVEVLPGDGANVVKLEGTFSTTRDAHLTHAGCGLKPHTRYRLSGQFRGSGGGVGAYFYYTKGPMTVLPLATCKNATEWKPFQVYLDTERPNIRSLQIYATAHGGKTMELKNFSIVEDPFPAAMRSSWKLENEATRLTLSGKGRVTSFVKCADGTELLAEEVPFCLLGTTGGAWLAPAWMSLDGDVLHVEFDDGKRSLDLFLKVYARYLTVTLIREKLGDDVNCVRFFDVKLTLKDGYGSLMNIARGNGFCAFLFSCTDDTNAFSYHDPHSTRYTADAYREYGVTGAKIAFGACPVEQLLDTVETMEIEQGLPHPVRDGMWLRKHPGRTASYLMAGSVTPQNVDEVIEFAKGGFGCIEMTDGWWESTPTYEPRRDRYPEGVKSLKEVADKIHAAGLQFGLHAMQGMVGWSGRKGMDDPHVTPVVDDRLKLVRSTLLKTAVDDKAVELVSAQPLDGWPESGDLNVDGEMIRYSGHTADTFTGCERGFRKTTKKAHAAGASCGLLLNCFPIWGHCIYTPDIESTLFGEIVERLAYVFNETGADMAYFDAGEEWNAQPPRWRNCGRFTNAFMARLKKPIFLGGNILYTNRSWHSIVRGSPHFDPITYGRDVFTQRFKGWAPVAHACNLLVGDVGWYRPHVWSLATDAATPDELELLGLKAVATDSPISVQAGHGAFYINRRMPEMLRYIRLCDQIKREGLLNTAQKQELVDRDKRHALLRNGDDWQIVQQHYAGPQVLRSDSPDGCPVDNPFAAQQPALIRLRALPQTDAFNHVDNKLVADFSQGTLFKADGTAQSSLKASLAASAETAPDGTAAVALTVENTADTISKWARFTLDYDKPLNLTQHRALGVWVKGAGTGGILDIQLTSTVQAGSVREHYVDLDFNGWKYVTLDRPEDVRYYDYSWPYSYPAVMYRSYPYHNVIGMKLFVNGLPKQAKGTILVSSVKGLREYGDGLSGASLSINGTAVPLPVNLAPHDYLEWSADGTLCVFERNGGRLWQGTLPMPAWQAGRNAVALKAAGGRASRALLTTVFRGETTATFRYREPVPAEPTGLALKRGDKGAWRLLDGNVELMPIATDDCMAFNGHAPLTFDFTTLPVGAACPAAVTITHRPNSIALAAGEDGQSDGSLLESFADAAVMAESPANPYARFVSGSTRTVDADGCHAKGVTASVSAAEPARRYDGRGVRFAALNRGGGSDWASRGFAFAKPLDLSDRESISLRIHGDGQGETLRVQLWDVNGRYADWSQPINFTGWKQLRLPLNLASRGFDFKQVAYFIVLFNGLPMNTECSVVLADLCSQKRAEGERVLEKLSLEWNGTVIPLPCTLRSGETLLLTADGHLSVTDAVGTVRETQRLGESNTAHKPEIASRGSRLALKHRGNSVRLQCGAAKPGGALLKIFAERSVVTP